MPKVLLNGVHIYYESHGEGFPLVLSYGVGGSTVLWREQIPGLSTKYQLILWDARGHGQSDSPHDPSKYGIPISAEDLHALMDTLGIAKAYVGGHSLGAGVATVFALKYPERVEALLLFNSATASGLPVRPELKVEWEKHIELALSKGMPAVVDEFAHHPDAWVTAKLDPVELRGLRKVALALDPQGYAFSVKSILDNPLRSEQLSSIRVPTLVLTAEHDPARPLMQRIAQQIPRSTFVDMKGVGHLASLDDPQGFTRHVLEFLERIELERRAQARAASF